LPLRLAEKVDVFLEAETRPEASRRGGMKEVERETNFADIYWRKFAGFLSERFERLR